jgi:hypothetical protein
MTMHYRSLAALAVSGLLAVTSLAGAPTLQAQGASPARFHADTIRPETPTASRINVLSRDRAVRWATAARVVHCGPAPLTERPGIESEFARPRVTPLESAFADAARVKRSLATFRMKGGQ